MRPRSLFIPTIAVLTVPVAACGGDDDRAGATTTAPTAGPTTVAEQSSTGTYDPEVDPADFVAIVDNPYFPMLAGSRWVYEGEADGEVERVEIVVTAERKTIMGIAATVVRDSVYVDGQLVEDTYDWFAQDRDGNVWYLGEDSKDIDNGEVVSTEGSWQAGVDGALPGIVMPAEPTVGDTFRQEYYVGEAEDMFEIIEIGGSSDVPAGSFEDVVTTKDWTPLEPDVIEQKEYAPGIGKLREEKIAGGEGVSELVEFTPPE